MVVADDTSLLRAGQKRDTLILNAGADDVNVTVVLRNAVVRRANANLLLVAARIIIEIDTPHRGKN